MHLQGGFVISDIDFGCDSPTHNLSPVREFAHSIFRHYNLAASSFREAMEEGLTKHGLPQE